MDVYYVKEHCLCSEEEKMECMQLVKLVVRLWKIGQKDGILALMEEVEENDFYNKIQLIQVANSLLDRRPDGELMRRILENYIILSDMTGKELLRSLIILEGFCGISEAKNKGIVMESICSYFGISFRDKFYKFLKPDFLDENCF